MAPKRPTTLWVIFASPEQLKGSGNRYIATDGTITDRRSDAATFYSFEDAKEFADDHKIVLNDVTRYIGRADFTDFEIQRGR